MTHDSHVHDGTLPSRAPRILIAFAVALLGASLVMSPAAFIALGPLKRSLTADNELTRGTAEATVLGFRIACAVVGLVVLLIVVRWRGFAGSRAMRVLAAHRVPPAESRYLRVAWNASLGIGVGATVVLLSYAALSPGLLPDDLRALAKGESGLVERGTALIFLVNCVLAFAVVNRLRKTITGGSDKRRVAWMSLLGVFFFVCVGEELSWGQRILGIETLDAFKGLNVQDENNLHNMLGYLSDHLFIAGVIAYGTLLPLIAARYPFWRQATHWLGLPVASVGLALSFAAVSCVHDWTLGPLLPPLELPGAEMREFLTSICLLLLLIESWRLAALPRHEDPAGNPPAATLPTKA